eukprot:364095-Chlamydomonas_euryale.AAC.1
MHIVRRPPRRCFCAAARLIRALIRLEVCEPARLHGGGMGVAVDHITRSKGQPGCMGVGWCACVEGGAV